MSDHAIPDLDALIRHRQATLFGRTVRVRPLSGKGYRLFLAIQGSTDPVDQLKCLDVAESVLVDATQAELDTLTPEQAVAVCGVAAGAIKEVEEYAKGFAEKNGDWPAAPKAKTTRRPRTPRSTPSTRPAAPSSS